MGEEPGGIYIEVLEEAYPSDQPELGTPDQTPVEPEEPEHTATYGDEYVDVPLPLDEPIPVPPEAQL